ncbi:DMT family transporter [Frigoribacterium sp. CG_9.8]|uniref:DMT family transporter n=1 Tax=Frigoribacterium sp. CG_9.8 TaxID=2787733 RepID=UPI0018C9D3FA|nr:DMT family transporter [Frigoribacterium sp. CG_9.8]MBG6107086.1 drug/metabolite transporter (DMT)-like permease [Frigoribacterium sp. CG_9.8]
MTRKSGVITPKSSTSLGLLFALIAAATFGMSGAFIKPILEAGWSPAAAVTVRALIGGIVLAPVAAVALQGRWSALWRARWRVLTMGFVGVAATQLVYFAAIERLSVSTAILLEYMAPLLLVGFVWATSRRIPKAVVLVGSVVAVAGLVLVVSPGATGSFDLLGLGFAGLGTIGCAIYYVVAARPSDGLPPVALAASGLLIGGVMLGLVGLIGLVPFSATFGEVRMLGTSVEWWVPLLVVGVFATAIAYAASITASEMLGSRLASFAGLLEVIAAALYAWLLLGERLSIAQLIGGALILIGIGFVRSEKTSASVEPGSSVESGPTFESDVFVESDIFLEADVFFEPEPPATGSVELAPREASPIFPTGPSLSTGPLELPR